MARVVLFCFVFLFKIQALYTLPQRERKRGRECLIRRSCSHLGTGLCEDGKPFCTRLSWYGLNAPCSLSLAYSCRKALVAPLEVDGMGSGTISQAILRQCFVLFFLNYLLCRRMEQLRQGGYTVESTRVCSYLGGPLYVISSTLPQDG